MTTFADHALQLAKQGIPVFPCRERNGNNRAVKTPYTPHGFKDATTDLNQIALWDKQYPNALVGVPTGEASGFFVLDVDVKKGKDGFATLRALGYNLPATRRHQTLAAAGAHYVFRYPADKVLKSTVSKLGDGLDTRGEDGYIIWWAAHGRNVEHPDVLADVPEWLLDALQSKSAPEHVMTAVGDDGGIAEGTRNNTLFRLGASLRGKGLTVDAIEAALLVENREKCNPPLDDEDVRVIARSAGRYPEGHSGAIAFTTDEGKPRAQVAVLIDIGKTHKLFHDPGGDAYAQIDEKVVCAVTSNEYRDILSGVFYKLTGKGANRNAIGDAVSTLSAIAKYEGCSAPVHLRVADDNGTIVIDSGDQDRTVYAVTPAGWRAHQKPPVYFLRSGKPLALPIPDSPDFNLLWRYVNVQVADRVLVAAWLMSALKPRGPYPILTLIGEQGTGKSGTARTLKRLTDPSVSLLRAPPQDVRDLMVAAFSSRVLALDNMSSADPQLSDALCRLSTGGALAGRTLYTNAEETLIEVQRPVILNGIDDLASRPDLAERCILIELPQISGRLTEQALDDGFRRDAPAIFAALLDALSLALRDAPTLKIQNPPRMADFAVWAAAGMPALGFSSDAFLHAYRANQVGAVEAGLESSNIGQTIRHFMDSQTEWTGTANQLLQKLTSFLNGSTPRYWPQSAKGLVNTLRRLAPALRHVGVFWEHVRTSDSRLIKLCRVAPQASYASQVSPTDDGMTLMTHRGGPCTAVAPFLEGLEKNMTSARR